MSLATRIAQEINSVRSEVVRAPSLAQPFSGYCDYDEIENNFVFKEDANFLASIADKNQYIKFGDKVVDTYGEELVVNGNFNDGTTGWSISTEQASIINGSVAITDGVSGSGARQYNVLDVGKLYRIKYSISNYKSGKHRVRYPALGEATQGNGDFVHYMIATDASCLIASAEADGNFNIDNISVKEVQTYNGTQHIPEVIVQDQATNGLNVQQSVSKGEFVVVDRAELLTNSYDWIGATGNTPPEGWIKAGDLTQYSVSNGILEIDRNGEGPTDTEYDVSGLIEIGKTYTVTVNIVANSHSGVLVQLGGVYTVITGVGAKTITVTPVTLGNFGIRGSLSTTQVISIDNISVKQVDETYRAIQDAPSGTALTDTNYFELNDDRPLTNPILVAHTMNDLTKSYEGLTGEVLFNDPVEGESTKSIMAKNGYSIVSEGLYSKGDKLYVPARIALC